MEYFTVLECYLVHVVLFLLLSDGGDGGLGVCGQDARLRVNHAQWAEHERLVLCRWDRRDSRVARERS